MCGEGQALVGVEPSVGEASLRPWRCASTSPTVENMESVHRV